MNLLYHHFEDEEEKWNKRNLLYHKSELQSNFINNTQTSIKGWFGILFFLIASFYLIHRFFKQQEMNEYEKLLKESEKDFNEARADFEDFLESDRNLFPGKYDKTDEIIKGSGGDDDDDDD